MNNEQDVQGSGRGPIRDAVHELDWRDWRKLRESSVGIAGVPTWIWAGHFSRESWNIAAWTNVLGESMDILFQIVIKLLIIINFMCKRMPKRGFALLIFHKILNISELQI
jgi:hypothetical protein